MGAGGVRAQRGWGARAGRMCVCGARVHVQEVDVGAGAGAGRVQRASDRRPAGRQ